MKRLKHIKLFHGSYLQNLKEILPKNDSKDITISSDPVVYATPLKGYSACFGFIWNDSMGFDLDVIENIHKKSIEFTIPYKHKNLLNNPMSIYEVDSVNFTVTNHPEQFISQLPAKIINEYKYKTVFEALKENGVKFKFI